jgi:hypothetical protein
LDGVLREVLTGWCQPEHAGLAVLTSRFPFADLDQFDGGPGRMLDVPPFTPAEGASLLAAAGGGWLPETRRHDLVTAVDGHALAVATLARLLADQPPAADLDALHTELVAACRTDTRVGKVLAYYADRLAEPDRWLVAIVALFQTPVPASTVLTLGGHQALGAPLVGRGTGWVELAARARARADQHTATGDPDLLARARDDADHALRLATRTRRLPWAELDALDAHTHLDDLTGRDHGWRHRADTLRATLIPTGLDPDPLTTNDKARKRRRQAGR